MTWLPVDLDGDEHDAVLGLQPAAYAAYRDAAEAAHEKTDRELVAACRVRIAEQLDCTSIVASSVDAPRSRDVVEFAEQFVIDPHGLDDDQRNAAARALTTGELHDFVHAISLQESYIRLAGMLELGPESPGSAFDPLSSRAAATRSAQSLAAVVTGLTGIDEVTNEAVRLLNAERTACRR